MHYGGLSIADVHSAPMSSNIKSGSPADFSSAVRERRRKRIEMACSSKKARKGSVTILEDAKDSQDGHRDHSAHVHTTATHESPVDFSSAVLKRRMQRLGQSASLPRASLIHEMNESEEASPAYKMCNIKVASRLEKALKPIASNILAFCT